MQPQPIPNDRPHIANLVIQDMRDRKAFGIENYATPLQAFNSRNSLQDAYEEALDLTVYLKQWLEERQALMYWLEQLFQGHDRRDAAAVIEATERLRSLYQSMTKDANNADS